MQLSKKVEAFSECFPQFLESSSTFRHFEKKDNPRGQCIPEITDCEMYG